MDAGSAAASLVQPAGRDTGARRTAVTTLRVSGLHCAACSGLIERALQSVPGVIEARVSAAAHTATVRWNADRTTIAACIAAVQTAGYGAVADTAADVRRQHRAERRQMTWRVFVAAFCAMQIMMLAAPAYFSTAGDLAPDLKRLLDGASWWLTLPVLLFSAQPFFSGAWRSISTRRIAMDVPVALGIAVAFVASSAAAWTPGGVFGSEVYFDSLTMFISFLLAGRWLEMAARHRAEAQLEQAGNLLPQQALRARGDGSVETVDPDQLRIGDRVRVPVGQAYLADGVLLVGPTTVDEALLSGESRPVRKAVGDSVVAGSINIGAPVDMRVERLGADTCQEAILALMRAAATQRPALVRAVDRWAAPFLWTVLLLAAGAAAVWSAIDPSRAVWVAVSVLIVTCPCALSLAAPSALLAAAGASARGGLLLRRLDALDTLSRVQHLFVDKTGTLTETQLACERVHVLALDEGEAHLRRIAASLAAWSRHPVAMAIAALEPHAQMHWSAVHEEPGRGLKATDSDGRRWRLGSAAWTGADAHGHAAAKPRETSAAASMTPDKSGAWLSCDGRVLAVFEVEEALRPDAAAALQALKADGVQVELLSGDQPGRVAAMAQRLGLAVADHRPPAERHAQGQSPQDKLEVLRLAQAQGRIVAMLGDGINDAPLLARADLSIAMGSAAAVARAQADAVLLSNALQGLVAARALGRRTARTIRQNFVAAAVYNAACVPLALLGYLPPWAAGLGMAASSLLVVLNSLRLARPERA